MTTFEVKSSSLRSNACSTQDLFQVLSYTKTRHKQGKISRRWALRALLVPQTCYGAPFGKFEYWTTRIFSLCDLHPGYCTFTYQPHVSIDPVELPDNRKAEGTQVFLTDLAYFLLEFPMRKKTAMWTTRFFSIKGVSRSSFKVSISPPHMFPVLVERKVSTGRCFR